MDRSLEFVDCGTQLDVEHFADGRQGVHASGSGDLHLAHCAISYGSLPATLPGPDHRAVLEVVQRPLQQPPAVLRTLDGVEHHDQRPPAAAGGGGG